MDPGGDERLDGGDPGAGRRHLDHQIRSLHGPPQTSRFGLGAGGWWAIVSPVLMTYLLLKVSGVALLEKDIAERRPGYRRYVETTSAFLPWFPRKSRVTHSIKEKQS